MKPEIAIQSMQDVIRRKHLSLSTEENYLQWLRRFMRFVSERRRDGKPEQKMESFLTQLARQDVSASTMGYLHAEALSVKSPLEFQTE